MTTISASEFLKGGKTTLVQSAKDSLPQVSSTENTPGFFSRVKDKFDERVGKAQMAQDKSIQGTQSLGTGVLQTLRQGANFVGDVAFEGIKSVTPQVVEDAVSSGVQKIAQSEPFKDVALGGALKTVGPSIMQWAQAHPEAAKNLQAVVDIGSIIPAFKGATVGGQGLLKTGANVGTKISKATETAVGSVKDIGSSLMGDTVRIPSRISTNLAERSAVRETIESLPTQVAKNAAKDGIDVSDLKYLYELPKSQKEPLRKLTDIVQKFSKGETKTNPIEVIGKPINNRIKQLETARMSVGKKLGEVADSLGVVTQEEVLPSVLSKLQKVPGLSDLKIGKGNLLNFKDTVLSTSLTKSDRVAIQKVFSEATKWGNGKRKHLLRQELFEILGGKKRSLSNITDTQEKAFNAIREGLSDVLETKNIAYKTLSGEYRKIIQPLSDIRKFMKNVAGADEDILDMSAGLLARRLTSNASSNPQIRSILRSLDNATKIKGRTTLNIENLQDFYNVLDKYYDIAGKTGLQGQVTSAIDKAGGGVKDFIVGAVKDVVGKTDAVKRKAFEDALKEALR